ncbi:hypothetical protein V7S43_001324 [Phytophthora oleae]|uniref:BZIP domain-containing protein n=1 Tax=Phytophthora oleae TaxID=2107226 RepID=A0ABD3G6I8_9STRA
MDGNTSVQTLISQFELMAQANASSAAPRTWSVTRNTKTELPPQPKSDNLPVKEIINRFNTQRARTQSEPMQRMQKRNEPAVEPEEETPVAKLTATTTLGVYKSLTVNTSVSVDEDDSTPFNTYENESDAESTITTKYRCYISVPRSPSAYSTASTGSLDSLLSSLDMFLPELLQASGESSPEIIRSIKPTTYRSRRSSLPENLQSIRTSKLVPPTSYRRASLTGKPSSAATKQSSISAPKSRRSSPPNPPLVAPAPARPRRSSLSAATILPTAKSTRRFSDSARGAPPAESSPRARSRSKSSGVPRYLDYDSSPRFMATKAMNRERRRQLEERNRSLAANKIKNLSTNATRKPRTPEWQGRLDQVRSRLFDNKEDNQTGYQSHAAKTKGTASRRHSTSSHSRS